MHESDSKFDTYRILVAIETDPTRYHGSHATRPRLLNSTAAEQMLAHVAADLGTLLPPIRGCSLAAAGALFDQTQILRPDYPVYTSLEHLAKQCGDDAHPGLISQGEKDGRIPVPGLHPEADIPLGLLQLLPVVIKGSADTIQDLGMAMEHQFIEQGQVSAHTAQWLENAFGIKLNHARFMTLTDLNAMFRLQLEHFGFLPLWELLDAAMSGGRECQVTLDSGQVFSWRGDTVHAEFETFDHWSHHGSGRQMDSQRGQLAGGYAEWTRSLRQYLTTLQAHGINVVFNLPGEPEPISGSAFFIEESARPATGCVAEVTEHSIAELGTVCVTVVENGRQQNYYPLSPQGLNEIHRALGARGVSGHTIAYPGSILYDEATRLLLAEPVSEQHLH